MMGTQSLDEIVESFLNTFDNCLDELEWQIENWWYTSSIAPPTVWYNMQNFFDPLPVDDGKSGLNLVTFALTRLTTQQANRDAWFQYNQAKWRTHPKTVKHALPKLKNDDAIRTYYLLYKLNLVVIDSYKILLGELELRRVYSEKELKKAKRDRVLRAHHQQTFDAYVERL